MTCCVARSYTVTACDWRTTSVLGYLPAKLQRMRCGECIAVNKAERDPLCYRVASATTGWLFGNKFDSRSAKTRRRRTLTRSWPAPCPRLVCPRGWLAVHHGSNASWPLVCRSRSIRTRECPRSRMSAPCSSPNLLSVFMLATCTTRQGAFLGPAGPSGVCPTTCFTKHSAWQRRKCRKETTSLTGSRA